MNLDELLTITRSYRTFEDSNISIDTLKTLIQAGRLGGSARNSQTLRFTLINSKEICDKIFPFTAWAGAIDWNPSQNESPKAYILISSLISTPLSQITLGIDIGIISQNILLKASDLNFGGCLIGSFNKLKVSQIVDLNLEKYTPQLLVALGKPMEKVTIIHGCEDKLNYHRDIENYEHFVPKLPLETLILKTL